MSSAAPGTALRLVDLRATLGRSLYCDFPAVVGQLELTGGDPPDPLRLASRLRALLAPFGANEGEGVGRDVDAHVLAGDDPATGLARCVAALAGYLQEMAGGPGRPAFGRRAGEGRAVAACPYELRDAGLEAMRFACSLVERLLSGAREEPDRLREEIVRFTGAMAALHLDPYGRALVAAARQRGIPAYRLGANGRYLQLGQGCRQVHFLETTSDRGSPVGVKLAGNKPAALELLHRLGLPVPEGGLADTADAACRLAESLGFPVVVKPNIGGSGAGDGAEGLDGGVDVAVGDVPAGAVVADDVGGVARVGGDEEDGAADGHGAVDLAGVDHADDFVADGDEVDVGGRRRAGPGLPEAGFAREPGTATRGGRTPTSGRARRCRNRLPYPPESLWGDRHRRT